MNEEKSTQVKGKSKVSPKPQCGRKGTPCGWICRPMPTNVPTPDKCQRVLHPHKDVFVLKISKVGANGDRRSKMELELVTPKGPERKALPRVDTRETQFDPEPDCYCCGSVRHKRKKK